MTVSLVGTQRLKVETEPLKIRIDSEPFVTFTAMGYTVAIFVTALKWKRKYYLYISAKSIAEEFEKIRALNAGSLIGQCFWISKEAEDKKSKYKVEQAFE